MVSSDDRAVVENAFGYYPDDVSPLSQAILCDDAAKADRLLAQGASPNQREPGGLTPVLIAAALSRDALLARLLQAGGDPNAYESDTRTLALSYALSAGVHQGDWRAYERLIDEGADINRSAQGGPTIARWASSLGQFDKVEQLLDQGYRADLPALARSVERRNVPDKAKAAQARLLARIRAMIATDRPAG
ncbi:ankyrin repeat domain-containing protein [Sphingobium naphthae]|uniref:Ankyrin repeat domain-containing protein n=1 Tax=Sphingobium naphthae TaxID=1886786 RepID=A0ABU3ZTK6_9SPHN|nr:hypothetical protein [Sphingobium naphthae]MDV5822858.1 hypothetical protein [Sphingobium naphthae]